MPLSCRGCARTPAETRTPVGPHVVAFTCSDCLMAGADAPPQCRRCLGAHFDAECEYNATEARAALAARCPVTLYSQSADPGPDTQVAPERTAEPISGEVANGESATSSTPPTIKTSRRGRPRVNPTSKRAKAAARQRAYRQRQATDAQDLA